MDELTEQDVFRPEDPFRFVDYAIVFGCDFHSEMRFRIEGAIELMKEGRIGTLLLSGGATRDPVLSEAEWMKRVALRSGVEAERILLEAESRSTQQNVLLCRDLILAHNRKQQPPKASTVKSESIVSSVALITSDWHMARVWMLARHHFPEQARLYCVPQQTTCNLQDWSQTIQCACLIKSEWARVRHAMRNGYPDPRPRNAPDGLGESPI